MTRGKYAARSAQRRATSAEDQLDRLLPELVEAKAIAKRYKADAELLPVVQAELKALRAERKIDDAAIHAARVEARAEAEEEWVPIEHAYMTALVAMGGAFKLAASSPSYPWISETLLASLRALPGNGGERVLKALGCPRDEWRGLLSNLAEAWAHGDQERVAVDLAKARARCERNWAKEQAT